MIRGILICLMKGHTPLNKGDNCDTVKNRYMCLKKSSQELLQEK